MSETEDQAGRGYHHGALRETLLAAAREIVEAEGVDAFTLRESARRAGVSHGAPAHHFGDKTGLLTELAVEAFEERIARSNAYMEAAGPRAIDRLKACGLAHIDYALEHPRLHDLCTRKNVVDRDAPALIDVMGRLAQTLIGTMSEVTGQPLKPEKEANPTTLLALVVVYGFTALVNERIILADVPDAERPARAHDLAEEMLALLEGAFLFRRPERAGG